MTVSKSNAEDLCKNEHAEITEYKDKKTLSKIFFELSQTRQCTHIALLFLKQKSTVNNILLVAYEYESINLKKITNENVKYSSLCSKPVTETTTTRQKGIKTNELINENINKLNGAKLIAVIISIGIFLLLLTVLFAFTPKGVS